MRFILNKTLWLTQEFTKNRYTQRPREHQKSVVAEALKLAPKCLKFAFYCIFNLQFSKAVGQLPPLPPLPQNSRGRASALTTAGAVS